MKRRTLIVAVASAWAGLTAWAPQAGAQAFPTKPIRVIVPYPAGGIVDLMARSVTDGLPGKLDQPVIVEAKPGASTAIGTEEVMRADPDGHVLLMGTLATTVTPLLTKVRWNAPADFVGVAHMGVVANIAVVSPTLGVKDMKGLIELAKTKPGQLNYMNPGNGSSPHVSTELLLQNTGTKMVSINYKGVPPSVPDLLSGAVHFGFYPYSTIVAQLKAGKAVGIAMAAPARDKQFLDIPTMAEQGFADSQVQSWYAFVAPRKTPAAVLERLNKAINEVLADPATVARVEKIGGAVVAGWSVAQTDKMIADDSVRWAKFTKAAGIEAK